MPGSLLLLRGPAGSGKSQQARRMLDSGSADVFADFTAIYAAVAGVERGADGKYPVRETSDARIPLTAAIVTAVARQGLRRGLRVVRTTSASAQDVIDNAEQMAQQEDAEFAVETVDPGEAVIRDRLSEDGQLSDECDAAIRRWVPMTDAIQCGIEFREVEDRSSPGRLVGTLLTYGERGKNRPEMFEHRSLRWPDNGIVLRRQHDRKAPIMRLMPEERDGKIVLEADLPDTQAGRDTAAEIRAGLFTGLSVEFRATAQRFIGGVRRISGALLTGAGLVDSPEYTGSEVAVRHEETTQGAPRRYWL